jgi:hypothetical protein
MTELAVEEKMDTQAASAIRRMSGGFAGLREAAHARA